MKALIFNPYGARIETFGSFKALRSYLQAPRGFTWQEVSILRPGDLLDADALLIPSGDHIVPPSTVTEVRAWVARGGNLLLLSAFGGDNAPHGHARHRCNLGQMLPGYAFAPNATLRKITSHDISTMPDQFLRQHQQSLRQGMVHVPSDLGEFRDWMQRMCGTGRAPLFHSVCHASAPGHEHFDYPHGCTIEEADGVEAPDTELLWEAMPGGDTLQNRPFTIPGMARAGYPSPIAGAARCGVALRVGQGRVLAWGSSYQFADDFLADTANLRLATWLLGEWLYRAPGHELSERMGEVQRHRLLHAYPMSPMATGRSVQPATSPLQQRPEGSRILVGVLPHPFCNPTVTGCGFCTFPHESFSQGAADRCAEATLREMRARMTGGAGLAGAACDAIYLGGATANLTSAKHVEAMLRVTSEHLTLDQPEVTVEGVPAYFGLPRGEALLDVVCGFTTRPRVSMGIQTFDSTYLQQMGRGAFGTHADITRIVDSARRRGITTSGDLLIDLPGQSLEMILSDIAKAADMGLDQICLYHLVLAPGLGTEWSRDPARLAALPSNEEAAARWESILARMDKLGFMQATLTNFERRTSVAEGRDFRYERMEMDLRGHDFVGFGPSAITRLKSADLLHGLTLLNPSTSDAYLAAVERHPDGLLWDRHFEYRRADMQVLMLTRQIARCGFDFDRFAEVYGEDARELFPRQFEAFYGARLVDEAGRLTARGQSYSDSMAGLLASREVAHHGMRSALHGHAVQPEAVFTNYSNTARAHWMG